jgi:hypothetical protein
MADPRVTITFVTNVPDDTVWLAASLPVALADQEIPAEGVE